MADNFSDDMFNDATELPQEHAGGAPETGRQRIRATKDMVSISYKLKQYWKNTGINFLLVLAIFFLMWNLNHKPRYTNEAKRLIVKSIRISKGNFSLKYFDNRIKYSRNAADLSSSVSFTTILPLALLNIIGLDSHFFYQLLSFFLSVMTIYFIYIIGKKVFSVEIGLFSALILIVFPGFIAYAAGISSVNFALFYAVVSLHLFIRGRTQKQTLNYFLSGVFAIAAVYSNTLSFVIFAAYPFLALNKKQTRKHFLYIIIGALSSIVLMNLFIMIFFKGSFFLTIRTFLKIQNLSSTASGIPVSEIGRLFSMFITSTAMLPFAFLTAISVGYTLRSNRANFPYIPMTLFIVTFVILAFFPISFSPYKTIAKTEILFSFFAPSIALLLGSFFATITNLSAFKWTLGGLLGVLAVLNIFLI